MSKLNYIEQAERWFGDSETKDAAQIKATLAIAEQLERIASALEWRNQLLEKEAKLFDLIANSDE